MWAKIITIKRTKDLNYFSLCALNLFNTQVSQFELNYWNKWTFPRYSNLLRCTCKFRCSKIFHDLSKLFQNNSFWELSLLFELSQQAQGVNIMQWWSVTKYNYFVTVLKYIFQVSVLYWSSFILSNFYFYFTTFQSIRSYFLLHYIS